MTFNPNERLTRNFVMAETCRSTTAERLEIDNTPPEDVWPALHRTAVNIVQPVRDWCEQPIVFNGGLSWFRSFELERVICKKTIDRMIERAGLTDPDEIEDAIQKYLETKRHPKGQAVDIECSALNYETGLIEPVPNVVLAHYMATSLEFDQVILEFYKPDDPTAGWVHGGFVSPEENRREVFAIGPSGRVDLPPLPDEYRGFRGLEKGYGE